MQCLAESGASEWDANHFDLWATARELLTMHFRSSKVWQELSGTGGTYFNGH